jgi:dTDP-4-dehydrorhamnose reductase
MQIARDAGQAVKAAPDAIHPVATSSHPTPARRPGNSRLETRKLRSTFGLELPAWQGGVERMLSEVPGR